MVSPLALIRSRDSRRAERVTWGLAAVAAATAGSVVIAEVARLARRRIQGRSTPSESVLDTAEHAIVAAGEATSETVAVAIEGYEATPRHETVLFNLLSGFLAGFVIMRFSSVGIRQGWWGGTVRLGGRHIHHFVPGILIAFGAGGAALLTEDDGLESLLALPFGAGIGLTFDEAALLLDLRDVYWTREGILSVQLSLGLSALLGATIIALRMLRRGEARVEQLGLIPLEETEAAVPPPSGVPH